MYLFYSLYLLEEPYSQREREREREREKQLQYQKYTYVSYQFNKKKLIDLYSVVDFYCFSLYSEN